MRRPELIARSVAAAGVCCIPFAVVLVTAWLWRDVVFGEIATQWQNDEVSTVAPTWTVLLLPLCGTLICAGVAVVTATELDPLHSRKAYFFAFGIGVMLAIIWLTVLVPNVLAPDDPSAPALMLLSPLGLLLGFIPAAIASLGASRHPTLEQATPQGEA
ncbi:hypothetical protein [Microbacterium gilvum]|uniref:Uncharacterized protein n=1 Tax=Microbacterium gilvum TaxID=1336204 RepID=A0ABP9ATJ9_9MICO